MVNLTKTKWSTSLKKKTPILSDIGFPNTLAQDTLVFTPISAPVSTNKLFKQFIKTYLVVKAPAPMQTKS